MPIFAIAAFCLIVVSIVLSFGRGVDAVHGTGDPIQPDDWFFIGTAILFFWAAIPAYGLGLLYGGMTAGETGSPGLSTVETAASMKPGVSTPAGPDGRRTQQYRLWQATRKSEDWIAFTSSVRDDLLNGRITASLVESRYPEAAASPGFREWVASCAAETTLGG